MIADALPRMFGAAAVAIESGATSVGKSLAVHDAERRLRAEQLRSGITARSAMSDRR